MSSIKITRDKLMSFKNLALEVNCGRIAIHKSSSNLKCHLPLVTACNFYNLFRHKLSTFYIYVTSRTMFSLYDFHFMKTIFLFLLGNTRKIHYSLLIFNSCYVHLPKLFSFVVNNYPDAIDAMLNIYILFNRDVYATMLFDEKIWLKYTIDKISFNFLFIGENRAKIYSSWKNIFEIFEASLKNEASKYNNVLFLERIIR